MTHKPSDAGSDFVVRGGHRGSTEYGAYKMRGPVERRFDGGDASRIEALEAEVERLREALAAANRAVSEAGIINPGEPLASRIWTLMVQRDMAKEVLDWGDVTPAHDAQECERLVWTMGKQLGEAQAEVERLRERTIGWLSLHVTQGDEDAARRVWEDSIHG